MPYFIIAAFAGLLLFWQTGLATIVFFACPAPTQIIYSAQIDAQRLYSVYATINDIKQTGNTFLLSGKTALRQPEQLMRADWQKDHLACYYRAQLKTHPQAQYIKLLSQAAHTPLLAQCRFIYLLSGAHQCFGNSVDCTLACEVL